MTSRPGTPSLDCPLTDDEIDAILDRIGQDISDNKRDAVRAINNISATLRKTKLTPGGGLAVLAAVIASIAQCTEDAGGDKRTVIATAFALIHSMQHQGGITLQ